MGIRLTFLPLGDGPDAIKGFYMEVNRVHAITVNSDLPLFIQKIIVGHELGHAELHRHCGVHAFHDVGLFDDSSIFEKEANLFAAEYLLDDERVLETLNADNTFFTAASQLNVPTELLDFKFRVMKWKGYKLVEPPIQATSNFLRDIAIPDAEPDCCC
jgi:Zn-dependent peptidase ImmA (M78 family)